MLISYGLSGEGANQDRAKGNYRSDSGGLDQSTTPMAGMIQVTKISARQRLSPR